jgi:cysteine desulfurase family protein (TIGR01976 family)
MPTLKSSAPATPATPTLAEIRDQFPALASPVLFLDNAGGSQMPRVAIDAVRKCLESAFGQLGGMYPASQAASSLVTRAHESATDFFNARGCGHVVLGSSASTLIHLIANAYGDAREAGTLDRQRDTIIVSTLGHEANIHPWTRLASRGFRIVLWEAPLVNGLPHLTVDSLQALLSDRVLLVAYPEVSNILGDVYDAPALTRAAHAAGARVFVDSVALAPHRTLDVAAHGHDWCVYSTYKVFGPHAGALYGSTAAFAPLTGPNHFFIPRDKMPNKFQPGGVQHEIAAAISAFPAYMRFLAGMQNEGTDRDAMERGFERIDALEREAGTPLIRMLRAHPKVKVYGGGDVGHDRVCTFSLTHAKRSSEDLARTLCARGFGVKHGDFYSRRLIERLGLVPQDGVLRISLSHYTTSEEMSHLMQVLAAELS